MGEILSQDEVDALLRAVEDGGVPTDGAAGGGPTSVRTLDLTNLAWSVDTRLPGLRPLVERFARAVRVSFGTFFGQIPQVTPGALQLVKFGSFVERLPRPVSLPLFRLAPLRGQGMLVVSPTLVAALLQVFFGGNPSRKSPPPTRQYSAIEQRVLERLGTRVLLDLKEAFRPLAAIEFGGLRSETNPAFAAIVGPQDLVVLVELSVGIPGTADAALWLCLPNAALDPLRHRLRAGVGGEGEAAEDGFGDRLRAALAAVELEVAAELGTHRMRLRDVLGLRAGDLLPLGTGREGPILVRVEGRPRFLAAPGVQGGSNAVRVTARI